MIIRAEFTKTDGTDVPVGLLDHLEYDINSVAEYYAKKIRLGLGTTKPKIKYETLYFTKLAVLVMKTENSFDRNDKGEILKPRVASLVLAVEEVLSDFLATETSLVFQEERVASQYPYVRRCVPKCEYQITLSCSHPVDKS